MCHKNIKLKIYPIGMATFKKYPVSRLETGLKPVLFMLDVTTPLEQE